MSEITEETQQELLFPMLGNIAILDDDFNEVKGLIGFLSKHGIAYNYYDGKINNFPEQKRSLQLLFIDLGINGAFDAKTLASTLVSNINALIDENNGPYCLALWSNNYIQNREIIDSAIDSLNNKPEFHFDMDKSILNSTNSDEELVKELEKNLIKGYSQNTLVHFMNITSNLYSDELKKIINVLNKNISSEVPQNKRLLKLINYVLDNEYNKFFRNGKINKEYKLDLFIPLLNDYISSRFSHRMLKDCSFKSFEITNDNNISGINELNFQTELLTHEKLSIKYPKNVYLENEVTEDVLKKVLKGVKIHNLRKLQQVSIDITHMCLIAQCKETYHNFVKGFLIDADKFEYDGKDYQKDFGPICINGVQYTLVVCCNHLSTRQEENINIENAICSISNNLFDYIRSIIADYNVRFGF